MRVLVACEYSGVVRDAFRARGHDAMSADLLPSDNPLFGFTEVDPADGKHHTGDVLELLARESFDLMVAHPPCTDLAVSGARWFAEKGAARQGAALGFVRALMDADVPRIAIENPVSVISSRIRPPDQIIQPWQHGHPETKATCLWLSNLPKLEPSNVVDGRKSRIHNLSPGPDRGHIRSMTYPGIAAAMADQWGSL